MKQALRLLPIIGNKSTGPSHDIVGVTYKDCPATWKKLKQEIAGDEQKRQDFLKKLQNSIR